ncbi:uncharacterized protein LOC144349964 [Saccoglossus kowalevskii]
MSHIDINNFATASFAEAYQKFRPTFPREVPEKIIAFMDAKFRYVTLKEHWFEGHKHVKRNPYEFYNPPFAEIETYGYITMERLNTTTVSDFIGLLRSFSAYNRYVHVHPEKQDLLQKIEAMIMQVLDLESPPEKTSLEFNYQHVFLITARKK